VHGNLFVDDEVLAVEGVHDLSGYLPADASGELELDIFLDPA
jgi:citronellol/citronellal dehydrogenase